MFSLSLKTSLRVNLDPDLNKFQSYLHVQNSKNYLLHYRSFIQSKKESKSNKNFINTFKITPNSLNK